MPLPSHLRSPVDMMRPRPVGISDASGFMYYLDDLQPNYQWRGNTLAWDGTLRGPEECDVPSEFLRPAILGPEPIPLKNARPAQYAAQNAGGVPAPTINQILGDDE